MTGSEITPDELRDSVRDFLNREISDERLRSFIDNPPAERARLRSAVADMGWYGLAVPSSHGGLGLGPGHRAALFEELGASLAPQPMLASSLAAQMLAQSGTDAQQQHTLARFASGELMGAVDCGAMPSMRLREVATGFMLGGECATLLDGDCANLLLVPALDDQDRQRWVILDVARRGISVRNVPTIDRTRDFGSINVDGLAIEHEEVLPWSSEAASSHAARAALAVACDAIGGATAILELTLDYLRNRRQFDRPIGSFQALKHRCAEHRVRLESARALVKRALAEAKIPSSGAALAPLAKAIACDEYARIAADSLQLHGGIGFTWEHRCHLYLRRAMLDQQLFGSSAEFLDRAASALVDHALAGRNR